MATVWSPTPPLAATNLIPVAGDRKSTRLNSSHSQISYAVFCLKKKKTQANLSLPGALPPYTDGHLTRPHLFEYPRIHKTIPQHSAIPILLSGVTIEIEPVHRSL